MGGLYKKVKKYSLAANTERTILGKKTQEALHPMGESVEAAYDANQTSEKALKDAENKPVIPIADEEEIERVKRRRNARGGGRASTVLSADGQGFGG